ncbi:MAG: chorismate synthase [Alphaproteobacteria bacterium]|nr:MAG: chorismate synthase [Alphaproteobacteria bacterium]|tara:strand:- start:725 stop:1828 length:1104 start_codon:yes stop_codon:yes gene_type:complete
MASNSFGNIFRYTTFGESHGPEIGCVIDGVPPGIKLTPEDIQHDLNKRKPGSSKFVTQRKEKDIVRISSGVFEGKTTGTPIALLIKNEDQKTKDYQDIKDIYRPSHADYTYQEKYRIRDYRGGGRSSARETAMRVAAGAVAKKVLSKVIGKKVEIIGSVIQLGMHKIDKKKWNKNNISKNHFFCGDKTSVPIWENYLTDIRKKGLSCGAIIEIIAKNVPVGLGDPIYQKLDANIASALMSINAVKGVEIGDGFSVVDFTGETNADEIRIDKNKNVKFLSNHAGGILGGISSGQDIISRFVVKPTSSILHARKTITKNKKETNIITKGRHDPCVGIRAVPVGEAMIAIVLADHALQHIAITRNLKNEK